jgi:hypothetical protein
MTDLPVREELIPVPGPTARTLAESAAVRASADPDIQALVRLLGLA